MMPTQGSPFDARSGASAGAEMRKTAPCSALPTEVDLVNRRGRIRRGSPNEHRGLAIPSRPRVETRSNAGAISRDEVAARARATRGRSRGRPRWSGVLDRARGEPHAAVTRVSGAGRPALPPVQDPGGVFLATVAVHHLPGVPKRLRDGDLRLRRQLGHRMAVRAPFRERNGHRRHRRHRRRSRRKALSSASSVPSVAISSLMS
jgi:hypothetical protein